MAGGYSGLHKTPLKGSSVEFAEYRKYVIGDDVKHLDWKMFGRSDRFYIKEFEAATNLRCYLLIDCSGSMSYSSVGISKFDFTMKAAATLAWLLARQGESVGLGCFAQKVVNFIPPRRSPSHLKQILNAMEAIEAKGDTDISACLHNLAERIEKRSLVIIFSDFFQKLELIFNSCQHLLFLKNDLSLFHVMDPQEMDLNFPSAVRFKDLENGPQLTTDPIYIRKRYQERVKEHCKILAEGCYKHKIDYNFVSSKSSYEQILADFISGRLSSR